MSSGRLSLWMFVGFMQVGMGIHALTMLWLSLGDSILHLGCAISPIAVTTRASFPDCVSDQTGPWALAGRSRSILDPRRKAFFYTKKS